MTLFDLPPDRTREDAKSTERCPERWKQKRCVLNDGHDGPHRYGAHGAVADPAARRTDPTTAHMAAESIRPASELLTQAIQDALAALGRPATGFEIADEVLKWTDRWQPDSIRTACARAGLIRVNLDGRSPGGRKAIQYALPSQVL